MANQPGFSSPFGSPTRTKVLVILYRDTESWERELERKIGIALQAVQNAVESLEIDGLIIGRMRGRTKLFTLNPSYFAAEELKIMLRKILECDPIATTTFPDRT